MNIGQGTKNPLHRGDSLPFAASVYRTETHDSGEVDMLRVELRNEVRALRTLMSRSNQNDSLGAELAAIRAALDEMAPETPKRDRTATWLRARAIEGSVARRVVALTKASQQTELAARIREAITQLVAVDPWTHDGPGRRIVALVGPAGVGKTTTVAKLAARAKMAGLSIGMVSCDSFRVGAIDQLERYADLIGANFNVARTANELAGVLEDETSDIVFVDTAGRAPAAGTPEAALIARRKRTTVGKGSDGITRAVGPIPVEVMLCMPAATRAPDAARIASIYAPVAPTSVCITKIDDTASPSALVHGPFAARRPLKVLCHGPRVPEDVTPATHDALMVRLDNAGGTK